jgi:hypothetical protein
MRTTVVLLVLTVLTLSATNVALAEAQKPPWGHTRPLTPGAFDLLARATERSSIVRTLLMNLEKSDVVVYLTDSTSGAVVRSRAYLAFVSHAAGIRYVLVRIDRWRLSPGEWAVSLGHELQHALEIAAAPEIKDQPGMARLYRHIGREGQPGQFESDGAQAISHRIKRELAGQAQ